ncbi:MAG: hypothetical protein M1831_003589 [Alyxoria varia]|nr:MAG: hypothetical protein M1831_003589 [Alyxoria varia]
MESSNNPLSGLWQPAFQLKNLHYGPSCVQNHLLSVLPSQTTSHVFIITTNSIASKTPLLQRLQHLLGTQYAGTFSHISQHAPVAEVDAATEKVMTIAGVSGNTNSTNGDAAPPQNQQLTDTINSTVLLSIGGGSPIDAAKSISHRMHERTGHFLPHITIPTTLSAAECTLGGGYTKSDGTKVGFMNPQMGVTAIFYDPDFARFTPPRLFLSTGIRALDHAVEALYQPYVTEVPWKALSLWAVETLFECLPKARETEMQDAEVLTRCMLAAWSLALTSYPKQTDGETSCITLSPVIALKARTSPSASSQIAKLLPAIESTSTFKTLFAKPQPLASNGETNKEPNSSKSIPLKGHSPSSPAIANGQHSSSTSSTSLTNGTTTATTHIKLDPNLAAALKVSTYISALVETMGLSGTLSERGVNTSEKDIIVERALNGGPSGHSGAPVDEGWKAEVEGLVGRLF